MTNEEKLQRLLEMQDHPERYTEEEIRLMRIKFMAHYGH